MRLIDADALIQKRSHAKQYSPDMFVVGQGYIMDAPTIETLRPSGQWIDIGAYVTTAYGSLDVYKCSNCNVEITIDDYDSFCPNCGAKMG